MRARVVLMIGLFAIGNAQALATAPLIADPREDLFDPSVVAPRLNDSGGFQKPAPGPGPSSERGEQNMAARPGQGAALPPKAAGKPSEKAADERPETPANPLWAVPLSQLTVTRDRPAFSPSRRQPQPVAVAKPVVAPPAPPPKPPEPVKPQLSLVGTIVGHGGGIGLFVDAADKSTIRLKAGENHKGWILRAIEVHQAELANGLDSIVLKLPPPDMSATAAAPPQSAPMAAQAQGTTHGMSPPAPAMPSSPANAAQPANTALSKDDNSPEGHRKAKLEIAPLVYVPPPPQPANPFISPVKEKRGGN